MFGIPSGVLDAITRGADRVRQAGQTWHDRNEIQNQINADRPQEGPRWARVMDGVGATLRDAGAAYNGQPTGAIANFRDAQQRMRSAREDTRRREARLEQFRNSIPETDRQFWQAYAMGGEEAALGVLTSRQEQQNETHTLARGAQLFNSRGELIAENTASDQDSPAIVASLEAAGIDPRSDRGREIITSHYQRELSPDMADIAARLTLKVQAGEPLTAEEQAAWDRIIQYRRAPDPFASWYGGNADTTATNDDPLGLRD